MNWILDKNRPICHQLCEQLCARIAAGEFLPGQRLMSVREVDAGTVQTMQQDLVHETLQEFFDKMRVLGIGPDETKSMVKEWQE